MFLCVGTRVNAGVYVGVSVGVCPCVRVRSVRATACQALDLEQIKLSINVAHCRGLGLLICFFLSFNLIFSLSRCSIQQRHRSWLQRFTGFCACIHGPGLPWWLRRPRVRLQGGRPRFDPWEEPMEKEMATHSSSLAWRTPWPEEPGGYSPWGCRDSNMAEQLTHTHTRAHSHACSHRGVGSSSFQSVPPAPTPHLTGSVLTGGGSLVPDGT